MKQEKPEMDDLERKKKTGCKGKILEMIKISFQPLALQNLHNLFLHILSLQNILSICFYFEKFFCGGKVNPPPHSGLVL